MQKLVLFIFLILLQACHGWQPINSINLDNDFSCCQATVNENRFSVGVKQILSLNKPHIIIGEYHGSSDSIYFVESIILQHLNEKKPIIFFYEVLDENDPLFHLLESHASHTEFIKFAKESFFWSKSSDGRASCALYNSLTRIFSHPNSNLLEYRFINANNADIAKYKLKGHAMAANIDETVQANPNSASVTLVGNNYLRIKNQYSLAEQSSLCGYLQAKTNVDHACIVIGGKKRYNSLIECQASDQFKLVNSETLDWWYSDFDYALVSKNECYAFSNQWINSTHRNSASE